METRPDRLAFAGSLYALGFATVFANIAFIVAVLPHPKLRSFPNVFLLSNSVADLFVGLYVLPVSGAILHFRECWPVGHRMCLTYYAFKEHFIAVSVAHLTAIAVERYSRVLHPTFHHNWMKNLIAPAVLLCWVLPSGTTFFRVFVPFIVGWYPYGEVEEKFLNSTCIAFNRQPCNCVACFTQASILTEAVLQYFIPMLIIFLCYGRILALGYSRIRKSEKVRQRVLSIRSQTSEAHAVPAIDGPQRHSSVIKRFFRTEEFRCIRVFVIIVIAFLVPWGPHAINRAMGAFGYSTMDQESTREAHQNGNLSTATVTEMAYRTFRNVIYVLGYSNSFFNPVLLFLLNRNYRVGFRLTVLRVFGKPTGIRSSLHNRIKLADSQFNELAEALETS